MAAGLGFKTFTTGEVLTAADTNGYLMQGVLVFASAAARDAAITSPQEGQFAYTKDTNGLWYYDGAAWVASGAAGDIEGVTAGVGISGGGTSGTVTVTNSMATAITTAGDLIKGTGSGTFDRLGIGSTGQVLTVASGAPSWATPSGSGASYSLISSVTCSGSAVTFSSLTSYNSLFLVLSEGQWNTTSQTLYLKVNGSTTAADYWQTAFRTSNTAAWSTSVLDAAGDVSGGNSNGFVLATNGSVASKTFNGFLNIQGAKASTPKMIPWVMGVSAAATSSSSQFGTNIFNGAAVSSISIGAGTGSWSSGTIKLYGSTI